MTANILGKLVNQQCRFLMDEYGFKIVKQGYYPEYFGDSDILLKADSIWLQFKTDRGALQVGIGPVSPDRATLFDLQLVVRYIAPNEVIPIRNSLEGYIENDRRMFFEVGRAAYMLKYLCVPILSGKFLDWEALDTIRGGPR